jgi:hypothetical protein
MAGSCLTAWDNTGMVFAIAIPEEQSIQLYSAEAYQTVSVPIFPEHEADPWSLSEGLCLNNHQRPSTQRHLSPPTSHNLPRILQ